MMGRPRTSTTRHCEKSRANLHVQKLAPERAICYSRSIVAIQCFLYIHEAFSDH